MAKQLNWFTSKSRAVQAGIGCGALILVCGCCSLAVAATSNNSNNTPGAAAASTSTDRPEVTNTPARPTATSKPKAWVTVKHLSGSGNSQSDTFAVQTGDHITSSCTGSSDTGGNLFIADLYRQGESYGTDLPYAELVSRANEPCSKDTYTVQQDGASVYLRVQADSITWTVDVQRLQ